MTLTVHVPDDVPASVMPGDASRALLEAYALEGYRSRRLTAFHVRKLLGHASRHLDIIGWIPVARETGHFFHG